MTAQAFILPLQICASLSQPLSQAFRKSTRATQSLWVEVQTLSKAINGITACSALSQRLDQLSRMGMCCMARGDSGWFMAPWPLQSQGTCPFRHLQLFCLVKPSQPCRRKSTAHISCLLQASLDGICSQQERFPLLPTPTWTFFFFF